MTTAVVVTATTGCCCCCLLGTCTDFAAGADEPALVLGGSGPNPNND
jgi:hypothetical protein